MSGLRAILPAAIFAATILAPAGLYAVPRQVKWQDLAPVVVDQTVSVALPDGAIVTGKAVSVESDALVLQVRKTSDRKLHPKGPCRVLRANLRMLELHTKRRLFRAILTPLGGVIGLAGGAGAAFLIQGGVLGNDNPGGAAAALIGITAAGAVGGYFVGNAADRRIVTIEILP